MRNSSGVISRLRQLFPQVSIVPLLFPENDEAGHNIISGEEYVVSHSDVERFAREFDFSSVVAMVVPFMTNDKIAFIKHVPKHVNLVWAILGGDLYNRYLRYMGYPLLYKEKKSIIKFAGSILRMITRRHEFYYLMRRCSAIMSAYCDYKLIEKYNKSGNTTPAHIYSIAYSIEKVMGPLYGLPFQDHSRCSIIVGNSASFTNNHLYVLEQLSKVDVGDSEISLISSYGNTSSEYLEKVKNTFSSRYGNSFKMISNYLSLTDYNNLLKSATHFLYGNWRQEAVGNILTALYLGGKVYLSKNNPLFEDLIEKGFSIFCLEEIDSSFLVPLPLNDKVKNREIVSSKYNGDRINSLAEGLGPYFS